MNHVDLMGSVRWPDEAHGVRGEARVRASLSHDKEHILLRRMVSFLVYMISQILPPDHPLCEKLSQLGRPLTPAQFAEVAAAAVVFTEGEAIVDEGRADGNLLNAALDIEEAAAALAAVPAPLEDADPFEEMRAAAAQRHADLLAAAAAEVLQLLEQRAEWRAAQDQAAEPQEAA